MAMAAEYLPKMIETPGIYYPVGDYMVCYSTGDDTSITGNGSFPTLLATIKDS